MNLRLGLSIVMGLILTSLYCQDGVEISPTSITISPSSGEQGVEGKITYNSLFQEFRGYDGTRWHILNSAKFGDTLTQTLGPHNFANVLTNSSVLVNSQRYIHFEFDATEPEAFLDISIPAGTKVTGLNAVVYDNHLLDNITVELRSNLLNAFDQPLSFAIASVTSSGSNVDYVKLTTNVALPATNDGDEYYTIRIYAEDFNGTRGPWPGDALRLAMVQIKYVLLY